MRWERGNNKNYVDYSRRKKTNEEKKSKKAAYKWASRREVHYIGCGVASAQRFLIKRTFDEFILFMKNWIELITKHCSVLPFTVFHSSVRQSTTK